MARRPDKGGEEPVSKAFAYRQAEMELGAKADLDHVHQFILEKFGVDMDKTQISQYRSIQKRRKRKQRRQEKHPAKSKPAASLKTTMNSLNEPVIDFLTDVRRWENKIGVERICAIIKALYPKNSATSG